MLWCDVYNAIGTRLNEQPILLMGAMYTRMLDGAGSFAIEAPLTDDAAVQALQSQRRVYIYTDVPTFRLVGAGIITRLSKKMSPGGWALTADGPDLLYELKYVNTLLNRQFRAAVAVEAMDTLLSLVTGWRMEADDSETGITARFDGTSVLKAMQSICEQTGLHFRYKDNRVIQAGAFGEYVDLTLTNPDSSQVEGEHTAIIDSLSVLEESEDICNWLIALGSGEGEAALNLGQTGQGEAGSPYFSVLPVVHEIEGSEGDTQYYVKDDASIALYGERRKVVNFDVSPLNNTSRQIVNAANQLYDNALEYLAKNSIPQVSYGVSVRKLEKGVLPGDQVRLLYFGPIRREDSTFIADEQIDALVYVIKVEERHSVDDVTWKFEVSNIDRKLPTDADIVVNEIEKAQVRNTKPGLTPSVFTYGASDVCSHQKAASFFLNIDESITKIISVKFRIITAPIYNLFNFGWNGTTVVGYFLPSPVNRFPVVSIVQSDASGDLFSASGIGSRSVASTAEYDITDYILNSTPSVGAAGYRFDVYDTVETLDGADLAAFTPSTLVVFPTPVEASGGVIHATFTVLAVTQAIRE